MIDMQKRMVKPSTAYKLELTSVPIYREKVIDRVLKEYGNTREYWEKAWSDEKHYLVDQFGYVWENLKSGIYQASDYDIKELKPGHKLPTETPYICLCGSKVFFDIYQSYDDVSCTCFYCGKKQGEE